MASLPSIVTPLCCIHRDSFADQLAAAASDHGMKKFDQGVGAIGLIVLAAVLASLLVTAMPLVKSEPPAHTSDWLGFAGGVVGGLMTLVAAVVAWVAVQRQIHAQLLIADGQAAIQSYNIVRDHIKALESESHLITDIELRANYTLTSLHYLTADTPIPRWRAVGAKEYFEKERGSLADAYRSFSLASENKASFPAGNFLRSKIAQKFWAFQKELTALRGVLSVAVARIVGEGAMNAADEALCRNTKLKAAFEDLQKACLEYDAIIRKERDRLTSRANEIRVKSGF